MQADQRAQPGERPRPDMFQSIVGYLRHQQQVDLWPFDLESGVLVKCGVGYLCANILVFLS